MKSNEADWWMQHVNADRVLTIDVPATDPTTGVVVADRCADEQRPLLVLHCDDTTTVYEDALLAVLLGLDASRVIDPRSVDGDLEWMQRCAAVRECMVQLRRLLGSPEELVEDGSLRFTVDCLLRCADRAQPVLLTGNAGMAAALLVQRQRRSALERVALPLAWTHPAADEATRRLDFRPIASISIELEPRRRDAVVRALLS